MKKSAYNLIILLFASLIIFEGCELAGLKYQKDDPFDASIRSSKINMNAFEFMKSRPDLFSSMIEAVNYAGLTEEYTKPDRTFLLLTNKALADETYFPTGSSVMGSYFAINKVPNPNYNPADPTKGPQLLTPDTWNVYPQEKVKRFLEYHIVKEMVSYRNAKVYPVFYESLAYTGETDSAKVSFHLINDRNASFRVNGFTGSRKSDLSPRTSGIDCTNGVVHVLDDYLIAPTKLILGNQ